jgi:hypothetical protein
MTQTIDEKAAEASPETDLVASLLRVLAGSTEPLTVSKIRAKLSAPFRSASLEELADTLQRQVAANVLFQYPKYRSQQDRFWDRPMEVHLAVLFQEVLAESPLAWPELRRKLPAYAVDPLDRAEAVLADLAAQGKVHQHPRSGKRGGERFGLQPPDAKEYLQSELATVLCNLEQLGFSQAQLRAAALELLHDEEWSPTTARQQPSSREKAGFAETAEGPQPQATPTPTQPSSAPQTDPAQASLQTERGEESSTPRHEGAHARPQTSPTGSHQS